MSFKGCDEVLPPQMFVALSDDNDIAVMVFVGEPIPREETFKQQTRHRYYFPVVTKEGMQVWGVGSKTYRTLRDDWDTYLQKCFTVTRHGASGSTSTTYTLDAAKAPAAVTKVVNQMDIRKVDAFLKEIQAFGSDGE